MSDRIALVKKYIDVTAEGIEIGPYHNPILPKADGNRVLIMDVYPAHRLREMATADAVIPPDTVSRIEEVDLLGSSDCIVEMVAEKGKTATIGHVVSSHNFEHLPNPIKFLQGCASILRPGGMVSMIVPDLRCCFDYFRPYSTTADFLAAFLYDARQPTNYQHFVLNSLHARYNSNGHLLGGFSLHADPRQIVPLETLNGAIGTWLEFEKNKSTEYRDSHCWAFTPSSAELILRDLQYFGYLNFDVIEVTQTYGHEFFIHLRSNPELAQSQKSESDFYEKRSKLLFQIKNEQAENAPVHYELKMLHAATVARYENQLAELRRVIG